jgi:hypothetical protein
MCAPCGSMGGQSWLKSLHLVAIVARPWFLRLLRPIWTSIHVASRFIAAPDSRSVSDPVALTRTEDLCLHQLLRLYVGCGAGDISIFSAWLIRAVGACAALMPGLPRRWNYHLIRCTLGCSTKNNANSLSPSLNGIGGNNEQHSIPALDRPHIGQSPWLSPALPGTRWHKRLRD